MKRTRIPLETKLAVIDAIDRGDSRSSIMKKYQLKNYSNINRILNQRGGLSYLDDSIENGEETSTEEGTDTSDNEEMEVTSENTFSNRFYLLTVKEHLEKIKLDIRLLEEVSNALTETIANTSSELDNVEDALQDKLDKEEESDGDDEDNQSNNSASIDEPDNNGENQQSQTAKNRTLKLAVQIQILCNTGETLMELLSKVKKHTTNFGLVTAGQEPSDESDSEDS